jgi:hypothetical protein
MFAPRHPHPDDVVIHHLEFKEPTKYTVAVAGHSEVPCPSFEEALDRAGHFATTHHVELWYEDDSRHVVLPLDGEWLARILAEYNEQPGLSLTRAQAQRLWGLDERTCTRLLDTLAAIERLVVDEAGRYRRPSTERMVRRTARRPVRARLRGRTQRKTS